MTNKIFIGFILIIGSIIPCLANETEAVISTATAIQSDISVSTKSAVFPKLLWEKTLTKSITSSAISKDGTKIAIADETGYLTLYNAKGEKLWDYRYKGEVPKRVYEFKSDKSDTAFLNLVFSNNGKYIICDVGVLSEQKYSYSFEDMFRYEPHKKFCFNDEGKLLWQTSKEGEHAIGGDKYVLIKPRISENSCSMGYCNLPADTTITYYLLDMKGQLVFTGKTDGDTFTNHGFSEDGKYVFVRNKLIECANWRTVWELERGEFKEINNTLVVYNGNVYDINTRKELLRRTDNVYKTLLSNTHAVSLKSDKGIVTVTVYEIKTDNITRMYQYDIDIITGRGKLPYLTKNGKYLLIGGEKAMQFYDISGRKVGELKLSAKVVWPQYFGYSVSKNAEFLLLGHEKKLRLYKPF